MEKPKYRSKLRLKIGAKYYGLKRKIMWLKHRNKFAKSFSKTQLEHIYFEHKTPLLK